MKYTKDEEKKIKAAISNLVAHVRNEHNTPTDCNDIKNSRKRLYNLLFGDTK